MGFGCAVQAAAGGTGGNRARPWAAAAAAGRRPSAAALRCTCAVRCGVMGCDCAGHGCEGHEPGEGVIMCGGSDWQVMLE